MEKIDFHAHVYPDAISEKAVNSVSDFYSIEIDRAGTVDSLLQEGREGGIDQFVVLSVATFPQQVQSINNFVAGVCKEHKEFIGFGTLHADMEDPLKEIGRIENLGLCGIKIHPDTQRFAIDDPKLMPVYERLENRLPILIHCGDYRYTYSHPSRLANILDRFPGLTVIAAHFGGWSIFDLALEYLEHRNCYLDVSSSIMFLGKRRAKELIRAYGAERILFGSDFPMWSPAEEVKNFMNLGLTEEENKLILYENAKKILNNKI